MLRYLRGLVESIEGRMAVLDVGGLGFAVLCSKEALAGMRIGDAARIAVAVQLTEGVPPSLFGFANDEERRLFEQLTAVKGVGGKLAMALLGALDASQVTGAILRADTVLLSTAPGIGRKLAERLCFELGEKIGRLGIATEGSSGVAAGGVLDALLGLGFSRAEAQEGLRGAQAAGARTETELLQGALSRLQRG